MPLPDYRGGSIVNLMASLVAGLGGGDSGYAPLAALESDMVARHRHAVLLVVDGLGYEHLIRCESGAFLRRGLRGHITSVFPSTTAAAITTFLTALAPQQHGLTGWFTFFRELGSIVAVLPFRDRHGGAGIDDTGIDVARFFGHRPVFDRIDRRCYMVVPQDLVDSAFNVAHSRGATRRAYATLPQFFDAIGNCLDESPEPSFTYAYWPELDRLAHEHCVASSRVSMHLEELDAAFDRFIDAIGGHDAIVIVTGDHGFIDTTPDSTVDLEAPPALSETLVMPLCGERRAVFCYVHPEKCMQFEGYVTTRLNREATLARSAELLAQGYFGLGTPHPHLSDRIGHYALIMNGNFAMNDSVAGEHRHVQVGMHGGLSAEEMFVPLIVFEP
ncbi:MAG: alkaline phosphatase family protein [Acidiferrobacterales bacterium]